MPSPYQGIAVFLEQLKAASIGVTTGTLPGDLTLNSERVQFSWVELSQDTDFIKEFSTIANGQPYLSINFPSFKEIDPEYRVSIYEIKCKLYFIMSANVDESYLLIASLLNALKEAWKDNANFTAPWGSVDNMTYGVPESLDLEQPMFKWIDIVVSMRGC